MSSTFFWCLKAYFTKHFTKIHEIMQWLNTVYLMHFSAKIHTISCLNRSIIHETRKNDICFDDDVMFVNKRHVTSAYLQACDRDMLRASCTDGLLSRRCNLQEKKNKN